MAIDSYDVSTPVRRSRRIASLKVKSEEKDIALSRIDKNTEGVDPITKTNTSDGASLSPVAKENGDGGVSNSHRGVLICTFLAFLSYAMLIPSLPDLLNAKLHGPAFYGTVQSTGNLMAMAAATPIGFVSDTLGSRGAVCGCFALGCFGSVLLMMGERHFLLPVFGLVLRRID